MARQARKIGQSGLYHVMLRGNEKKDIFKDKEDKHKILNVISDKKKESEFLLYAYCIMSNHLHLLIKENVEPLSLAMKRIGVSYASYYNKKHDRVGHVFQGRFKSENVEDDRYLLSVIRYIHNNPLEANISTREGYQWSSYNAYIGQKSELISEIEIEEILGMFSNNKRRASLKFAEFSKKESELKHLDIEERQNTMDKKETALYFSRYLEDKGLNGEDLKTKDNIQMRNDIVKELKALSGLSNRILEELTGINRETIRKIINCQGDGSFGNLGW